MYAFLRRPIWILSHVLIALLVIALVGLGFWQRSRFYEEKGKKEKLETLAVATAVPYDQIVPDSIASPDDVPETARYRRVEVSGVYDAAREVVILNRSRDGAPGAWVLTPLVQANGVAVPVVRGWIPYDETDGTPPFAGSEPPEGEVTVTGNIQLTQERGSFGGTDPAAGTLTSLSRVDLNRFAEQLPFDVEPAWVLLDAQSPAQPDGLPATITLQTKDPSTNFGYMMQWWIFALIAACGYPLVLRVVARNKAKGDQTPEDDEDDGGDRRRRRKRRRVGDEIPWAEGLGPDASADAAVTGGPTPDDAAPGGVEPLSTT
ncbi:SURF1 family protein [soil metagenome]